MAELEQDARDDVATLDRLRRDKEELQTAVQAVLRHIYYRGWNEVDVNVGKVLGSSNTWVRAPVSDEMDDALVHLRGLV